MSYRVFDRKLDRDITKDEEWVVCPDGSLCYLTSDGGLVEAGLIKHQDAFAINDSPIYLITVFDKCEPDERFGYKLGCTRSVGFRYSFELAEEVVKTNMCDIWEYSYDYACIEELVPCLYPWAEERWFYKFNREKGGYEEIDEPVILKNRGPIGGIG